MEAKPELDLRGKLIIKVQFGDDIRRIPIHNESITYDELVLMMQRVFRGKLSAKDEVTLKYKDEDGDLVTIFDSTDLSFAIQCSHILKLHILLRSEPKKEMIGPMELANLKSQIRAVRVQIDKLLDIVDDIKSKSPETRDSTNALEEDRSRGKVSLGDIDSSQEKHKQNGNEEQNEPIKSNESLAPNARLQSVSMVTNQSQPMPVPTSAGASNPHITDYYTRSGLGMQYPSMGYAQQYNFSNTSRFVPQAMDSSASSSGFSAAQTPSSATYATPQQPYGHPVSNNPYVKAYGQQPANQGYLPPPRQ